MLRSPVAISLVFTLGLVPAPLEKVTIEFKHPEGQLTKMESTSKIHQILNLAGMDIETRADNKVTVSRSVGKRSEDGRLPIKQQIDAFSVHLSLPGGVSIDFDSANPNVQNENPMIQALLDTYRARVGSSHTIVLDKNNKVVGVEGTEKLLENATPAAAEMLKGELNPALLKKAAEQGYAILPDGPVAEGDTWTRTTDTRIGGGQTMTFETKFEYLGTVEKDGKKLDKISMSAQTVVYAMDPEAPSPLKVKASNLKIESSKGHLLFDRAIGQPVESNSVTRIVGDMTLTINDMEIPSTLDLTFDSSSALVK